MGDVVPHDRLGIGGEGSLDVVGVFGGEVAIDDVQPSRDQNPTPPSCPVVTEEL